MLSNLSNNVCLGSEPAFIKHDANEDGDGVIFTEIDGNGTGASRSYVRIDEGYILQ
jgi:hypothetical protein